MNSKNDGKGQSETSEDLRSKSSVERLVMRLRHRLWMDEDRATDEQILEMSRGTWLRAATEFEIACEDLGVNVKESVENVRKKMHTDIERHIKKLFGADLSGRPKADGPCRQISSCPL